MAGGGDAESELRDAESELRDAVTQALERKGVLGKIRAQLRASVFLAIEEQESKEAPHALVNGKIRNYLRTKEGQLAAGIVREFLEHFELDFTCAVFDPETDVLSTYPGRDRLATLIGLNADHTELPLLAQILERVTSQGPPSKQSIPDGYSPTTALRLTEPVASVITNLPRTYVGSASIASTSVSRKGGAPEASVGKSSSTNRASIAMQPAARVSKDLSSEGTGLFITSSEGDLDLPLRSNQNYDSIRPTGNKAVSVGNKTEPQQKQDGDGYHSDGDPFNISESTGGSEWFASERLETTDVSVSNTTLSDEHYDHTEPIHSQ